MDEIKLPPRSYICNTCSEAFITPQHCGRPMTIDIIDNSKVWMCWKGDHAPCCGRPAIEEYHPCCDDPQLKAALDIDESRVIL